MGTALLLLLFPPTYVRTYPTKFSDILEIRGDCQVHILFFFASSHVAAFMWDPALPVYII